MMETLYDKMFRVILDVEDEYFRINQAKACERVAKEAQIDLLECLSQRLKEQYDLLRALAVENKGNDQRLNGKLEGIKLAIENNRQGIQELKRQLAQ